LCKAGRCARTAARAFRAGHYQAEIDHLGIARSPAYHDEPATNGCVAKFIQTRDVNERCLLGRPAYRTPRMARETLRQTAMDDRYVHQPGVPVNRERRTKHLALPAIRATTHANGKVLCLSRLSCLGTRASSETPVPASNAT
jgi:hypothetical protein